MKTISDILPFFLSELQVFYPENEIKSLAYISIKQILNMSKSDTIVHSKKILEEDQILRIKSSISSLKEYEPIQYVFTETEFYKREFYCMYGENFIELFPFIFIFLLR